MELDRLGVQVGEHGRVRARLRPAHVVLDYRDDSSALLLSLSLSLYLSRDDLEEVLPAHHGDQHVARTQGI